VTSHMNGEWKQKKKLTHIKDQLNCIMTMVVRSERVRCVPRPHLSEHVIKEHHKYVIMKLTRISRVF
jgi:hypothetical protein